jgi:hypothetical protein
MSKKVDMTGAKRAHKGPILAKNIKYKYVAYLALG